MLELERGRADTLSRSKANIEMTLDDFKSKFNKMISERDHEISNLKIDHENLVNQNKY